MHGVQSRACRVHAGNDQVRADVALVSEEVLLQHCHAGDHAGVAACRERVQFDIGADEGGGELGVGGCTGSGTPDLRGDVVKFLAVLSRRLLAADVRGRRGVKPSLKAWVFFRSAIHTLSATIGPLVALVSAAICDPSSQLPWTMEKPQVSEHWDAYHNALIVNASHNCCTSAGGFGKWNTPGVKSRVAVVVGEVEARHRDNTECTVEEG